MNRIFPTSSFLAVLVLGLMTVGLPRFAPAQAAPVGKASADFDNSRPDKTETEWGRLVADATRAAAQADIALVYSGALRRGTLRAGNIESTSVNALLSFGDDEVVSLSITGAQLRAALERAVQAYPDPSPAFLQCSGLVATFNAQAPTNRRVTMVRIQGREVENRETFTVAMPISLAQGAAGYFTIWRGDAAKAAGTSMSGAVIDYIRERNTITPDDTPRFSPQ
jgi:2',3'-cyclic-nucleotide 2'-phosphodiesterase (5'-nucleotidase family)